MKHNCDVCGQDLNVIRYIKHNYVCRECLSKHFKYREITKTSAKTFYGVTDKVLASLPYNAIDNPRNWNSEIKVYLLMDVIHISVKKELKKYFGLEDKPETHELFKKHYQKNVDYALENLKGMDIEFV